MTQSSPNSEINGTVTSISLPSLIHMLSWEECSCKVIPASSCEEKFYFENGKPIDAEIINSRGISAVFKICTWSNPIRRISSPNPTPKNVDLPFPHITHKTSQYLDKLPLQQDSIETGGAQSYDFSEDIVGKMQPSTH